MNTIKKAFFSRPIISTVIFLIFLFPFVIALRNVLSGSIPFWYDPARDFLLALGNLSKPTLIGPPTGIPGIFYGPYWIWLLSLGLVVSKDPRIVTLVALTIPYFVLLPFIFHKYSKYLTISTMVLVWLLFFYNFNKYGIHLWNPHLAPLLSFVFFYLMGFLNIGEKQYLKIFLAGVVGGLILNFHVSFGIGIVISGFLFLLFLLVIYKLNKKIKLKVFIPQFFLILLTYSIGFIITFIPFFTFEVRHGFNQTETIIDTLKSQTAVVQQTGLTQQEIIKVFLRKFSDSLSLTEKYSLLLFIVSASITFIFITKKRKELKVHERQLIVLIILTFTTTLFVYLSSKNPVYEYHFIGVEILVLLLFAIFVNKISYLKNLLIIWVVVLTIQNIRSFAYALNSDPYVTASLATKEHIVDLIYKDANGELFTVFVYSSAIYTFDYDFLFEYVAEKRNYKKPLKTIIDHNPVYLIVQSAPRDFREDFIDNKTPNKLYSTVKEWKFAEDTLVLKRIKK